MKKRACFPLLLAIGGISYADNGIDIDCQQMGDGGIVQCHFSANEQSGYGITNMPYALCSKARCLLSDDKKSADCRCQLQNNKNGWQSLSLSPTPYASAKPTYNKKHELQSLQSNYSQANVRNFNDSVEYPCHYDSPQRWANCYGVRCQVKSVIVDAKVQQVASCLCPVKRSTSFYIGESKASACDLTKDEVLSASSGVDLKNSSANPIALLYQKLYPGSLPTQAS
ncbi:MAG: hypothetical protein ACO2ZM_03865 [Francisellaceae bacterium]